MSDALVAPIEEARVTCGEFRHTSTGAIHGLHVVELPVPVDYRRVFSGEAVGAMMERFPDLPPGNYTANLGRLELTTTITVVRVAPCSGRMVIFGPDVTEFVQALDEKVRAEKFPALAMIPDVASILGTFGVRVVVTTAELRQVEKPEPEVICPAYDFAESRFLMHHFAWDRVPVHALVYRVPTV